jgi:hypothetical protein
MADDTSTPRRGPSDATDYSSTKAPETQKEAEERHPHPSDNRLNPGGAHGTAADPGMSSLDRDTHPTGGKNALHEDFGGGEDHKP